MYISTQQIIQTVLHITKLGRGYNLKLVSSLNQYSVVIKNVI